MNQNHFMRYSITTCAAAFALASLPTSHAAPPLPAPDQKADPQMKAVLYSLISLGGKPIEKLTPAEARKQPGPPDAIKALLKKQGKSTDPEPVAKVEDRTIPGPGGSIPVRVYTPEGTGAMPVLVYFHGGGWVIAGIQAYDSSCRALANAAKCVVVSVGYRYAPENRFPSAHEDSYTATQYIMKNAEQFGGDPKKVAVGGESAGGNLAAAVCLMARDRKGMMPIYQMLVYPVVDGNAKAPSAIANYNAKPLNTPMLKWFLKHTLRKPSDVHSPYFAILENPNVKGVPPATIISAQIDPLLSGSKAYANKLQKSGVSVRYRNYDGVTHEFFGMGAVVDKAKAAVAFAAEGLQSAFNR